jgi:uncharacterized membrane protein (DUF106 family)
MSIEELIALLQNKINTLQKNKKNAEEGGDIATIEKLEGDIAETEAIITKLKS